MRRAYLLMFHQWQDSEDFSDWCLWWQVRRRVPVVRADGRLPAVRVHRRVPAASEVALLAPPLRVRQQLLKHTTKAKGHPFLYGEWWKYSQETFKLAWSRATLTKLTRDSIGHTTRVKLASFNRCSFWWRWHYAGRPGDQCRIVVTDQEPIVVNSPSCRRRWRTTLIDRPHRKWLLDSLL